MVIHLYGRGGVWCGAGFDRDGGGRPTHEPEHSNCKECLGNAAEFGKRAAARLKRI
jgi:hypothetical protein